MDFGVFNKIIIIILYAYWKTFKFIYVINSSNNLTNGQNISNTNIDIWSNQYNVRTKSLKNKLWEKINK